MLRYESRYDIGKTVTKMAEKNIKKLKKCIDNNVTAQYNKKATTDKKLQQSESTLKIKQCKE